ncbi:MAG: iron-containing alcohol dehydrogenase [Oscillospiraceae bacterium]
MEMLRPQVADADMIFAVGGGKAIDTCKVLAHETNRPFFTFPTIASTCASCTSLGIVYHPDGSLREYSFSKIPPDHIFIDTEIIANAPVRYLGPVWATLWPSTMSAPFPAGTMCPPIPMQWALP